MMMKKLLLVFFTMCLSFNISGQTTNEGIPESWNMVNEKSSLVAISMNEVNIKAIKKEDEVNDNIRAKPFRIGIAQSVNYGLTNAGTWTELENGDRIWRIGFNSKNALNLSVNFDKFKLPEGGKVYLYSDDRSDLLGAYTKANNNAANTLGSWFVKGDKLWVEYYEPKEVSGEGQLHLSSVIHGYRLGNDYQKGYFKNENQKIDESGDCNQDVDCPIGADFEAERDMLKKSVAFLNLGNGFVCSGSLINNTNEDNTPYFLTANHCLGGSNPASYSMRFNWISPNPDCATTSGSAQGPLNFVMNGSTLRANNSNSDLMLVELNNDIPATWDVTYAGWDRTDDIPSFTVGIHHPSGDIMKICRDDNPPTKIAQNAGGSSPVAQTWDISGLTNTGNTGNTTGWELGVTEGGSSGSALYDQNGRIIGQLYGGLAACSGTNDNNAHDYYGRFSESWDAGGTASTQLRNWLDPAGTNPMTTIQLNTLSNNIYFVKITEVDSNKILVKKIVLSK